MIDAGGAGVERLGGVLAALLVYVITLVLKLLAGLPRASTA